MQGSMPQLMYDVEVPLIYRLLGAAPGIIGGAYVGKKIFPQKLHYWPLLAILGGILSQELLASLFKRQASRQVMLQRLMELQRQGKSLAPYGPTPNIPGAMVNYPVGRVPYAPISGYIVR